MDYPTVSVTQDDNDGLNDKTTTNTDNTENSITPDHSSETSISGAVDVIQNETIVQKEPEPQKPKPKTKLSNYLEKYPVCQKRTGRHKQFVILYGNIIIKGPYTKEQINKIDMRSKLLKAFNIDLIVHPLRNNDGSLMATEVEPEDLNVRSYCIYYPNLAAEYPQTTVPHQESFSNKKYNVIETRVGLIKTLEALKTGNDWIYEPINIQKLIFAYIHLYLLNVGDTGLFNSLADISKKQLYVIDYDEDRSSFENKEFFYFSKDPAYQICERWLVVARPNYPYIQQYFINFYNNPTIQQIMINYGYQDLIPEYFQRLTSVIDMLKFYSQPKQVVYQNAYQYSGQPVLQTGIQNNNQIVTRTTNTNLKVKELKEIITAKYGILKGPDGKPLKLLKPQLMEIYNQMVKGGDLIIPTIQEPECKVAPPRGPPGHMVWYTLKNAKTKTYSGHPIDVMISGIQKYIRRGNVTKALQCAIELYRMDEISDGKKSGRAAQTNLYNRLAIICAEDIGPANLPLVLMYLNMRRNIDPVTKKESFDRSYITLAALIHAMCESPKTRIMSHYARAYIDSTGRQVAASKGIAVEPMILTEQDARYAEEARKISPFWKIGDDESIQPYAEIFLKKLQEHNPNAFMWLEMFYRASKDKKIVPRNHCKKPMVVIWHMIGSVLGKEPAEILQHAYTTKSKKNKGDHSKDDTRAFLYTAVTAVLGNEPYALFDLSPYIQLWSTGRNNQFLEDMVSGKIPFPDSEIDDFVKDMHTDIGRRNKLDRNHFVNVGAVVHNQSMKYFDPVLKEIYEHNAATMNVAANYSQTVTYTPPTSYVGYNNGYNNGTDHINNGNNSYTISN
jgi:hypothetical protein